MISLHLKRGREKRIRNGHCWAFAGEIQENLKGIPPGEGVTLCESRGKVLGRGYVNPHSLIAVRLITKGTEPFDESTFERRIATALKIRQIVCKDQSAYRLIFSEADGIPGLIVDRYLDHLVIQSLTQGIEIRLDQISQALEKIFNPKSIFLKANNRHRVLEGLTDEDVDILGHIPDEIEFKMDGASFLSHPRQGQKTGFFLDQNANRKLLRGISNSKDVLDLFCYSGAWGVTALKYGANRVDFVDSSQQALSWARISEAKNGFSSKSEFIKSDDMRFLNDCASTNRMYDIVIVDPPALISSKSNFSKGKVYYGNLNTAALNVVKPHGTLITCSCSYHLSKEDHMGILAEAAIKSDKQIKILQMGGQSSDHPILPGHPETEYLKCSLVHVS